MSQQSTGVQIFAIGICREFIAYKAVKIEILVPKNAKVPTDLVAFCTTVGTTTGILWEQVTLPYFAFKKKVSVLLNLCNIAPLAFNNNALVIHDIAFFINKNWFSKAFATWYRFAIPILVRKAKCLFTVSPTVAKEIIAFFNILELKVGVLGNKIAKELLEASPAECINVEKPFFLMVGSQNPRKNYLPVIQAFESYNKYQLVIVGARMAQFGKVALPSVLKNTHFPEKVKFDSLKWLYQNCEALIQPSHYEGFGIPILEALYFKKPVICNSIEVFKFLFDDVPMYIDANNTNAIINVLNNWAKIKKDRLEASAKGFEIAQKFQNCNYAAVITHKLETCELL